MGPVEGGEGFGGGDVPGEVEPGEGGVGGEQGGELAGVDRGGVRRCGGGAAEEVGLAGHQDVGVGDGCVGRGGEGVEDEGEASGEECGGVVVEQVGGVVDVAADSGGGAVTVEGLRQVEVEVELGGMALDGFGGLHADVQTGEVGHGGVVVLEFQHGLEERVPAGAALWCGGVDDRFERRVLVVEGAQVEATDTVDELEPGRVAGEIGAQRDGVDEETDEVGEGFVGAAGGAGADRDVVAAAEAVQEGGEGGVQDHEEACAALLGDLP